MVDIAPPDDVVQCLRSFPEKSTVIHVSDNVGDSISEPTVITQHSNMAFTDDY
jgi:hypothetical protein